MRRQLREHPRGGVNEERANQGDVLKDGKHLKGNIEFARKKSPNIHENDLTESQKWCTFVYIDEILLYKTDNAEVKVEILLQNENLWLTQAKMADLFDVQKAAISKHLKNIFAEGELQDGSVVSKMETTAADGKNYNTNIYNLDGGRVWPI